MNINQAIQQARSKKTPSRAEMPDGMLTVSDGVFYATLHRMGARKEDYKDVSTMDRVELLNELAHRADNKL